MVRAAAASAGGGHVEPTGVGRLDPGPKADSVTNRMDNGDFRGAFAKQFAISPGGLPLLFVVKKNGSAAGGIYAGNHVKHRGLTGPVGPDQAQDASLGHFHIQVADSRQSAESFGYVF